MRVVYYIIIICASVSMSCNQEKAIFQVDWIIMEAYYEGNDILSEINLRNLRVDLDRKGGGMVPSVFHPKFKDESNAYSVNFKYLQEVYKEYLIIQGSKFFTDTFEILRLDEKCCSIALKTRDKYIRCIYNSELSPFMKRRDCPHSLDMIEGQGM